MRLTSLNLQNYRSYSNPATVKFDNINVLTGRNNSGKSALIRSIAQLQTGIFSPQLNDVRKETTQAVVTATLSNMDFDRYFPGQGHLNQTDGKLIHTIIRNGNHQPVSDRIQMMNLQNGGATNFTFMTGTEPNNFIYPYLAKRKVTTYDPVVDLTRATSVRADLAHLTSKIQRLANEDHPKAATYTELCRKVLGYKVSNHAADGGQQSGIHIGNYDYIPIEDMGEGVPNLLGLITMLCLANEQLFLIEELENDIHPEALKALLEAIIERSDTNQFIISTHSNIVVKWLGSAPNSKLYSISQDPFVAGAVPTTRIAEVERKPQARIKILEELGYELGDFEMWDGWLFLEESSAERIIRDYLIPLFAPKLSRIRPFATKGTGRLKSDFDNFNRLFVFTHLSHYINKAWVIADGDGANDTSGATAIELLKETYCRKPGAQWHEANFFTWSKHDFEEYYPFKFNERVASALSTNDKRAKREAKKVLLEKVVAWCDQQKEANLRSAFKASANEVIEALQRIESELVPE